jgi:acetyltransferase-like isoleucine patch superfamily enzyme
MQPLMHRTLAKRLLYKLYLLILPAQGERWFSLRRWLLNHMLGREHAGLEIHPNVYITGWWNLRIGDRVTINRDCVLLCEGGLEIGDDTMIAHGCSIITSEHGQSLEQPMRAQPLTLSPVSIGRDVWLGARVIVLGGSVLAEGSIAAAGAVIKGRFAEPRTIVGGVPAKLIRRR